MFSETKKYKNQGHFFFKKGDAINDVCKDMPRKPGVYYIIRLARGKVDLVYIGELPAGAIHESPISLPQQFLDKKMMTQGMDGLDIYWFITMDEKHHDLPEYVKGLLMQRYFDVHGHVPPWNNEI